MNYIDVFEAGDASRMLLRQMAIPACGDDEILIQVKAAGVNRPDILQRQGVYPPPADASPILGLEVAGTVVAVGSQVSTWKKGDRVCGLCNGGGYAEYVNVPASQCLPVPSGLNLIEAASLPEAFFTVWSNVFERAKLQAGEHILIHGGSSGIGVTAIQLAKAFGATVYTTAGSQEKCDACIALGAHHAINYRQTDFSDTILTLTDKRGVDVILDMVGGDYIGKNIRSAAVDGRIVNIAFLNGAKTTVNFMPVMLKRLTLTGSTLRPRSSAYKASIAAALQEKVWPLLESSVIKPVISQVFALENVTEAHQFMESNQHIGKIVLTPNGTD